MGSLSQNFTEYSNNGVTALLPASQTNVVNNVTQFVSISPYIIVSGLLAVPTSMGIVYDITVPTNTYIESITILPSSTNVQFYLVYGNYLLGNPITKAITSTTLNIVFPSPFFPLIPIGAHITLYAMSSSSSDTIQLGILGVQQTSTGISL
ncbi:MAG: hypothetical protein ACP5U0_07510 [Caldisphaera sp.]